MKTVVQEDGFGCGVACVSSLLQISYKDALKLFQNGKKKATVCGFSPKNIVSALQKAGLKYKTKYIKKKKIEIINGSIVYVGRCKKYPFGHYLLKTEKGWMNPWINLPYEPRIAGFSKRIPAKIVYIIQTCKV